MDIALGNIQTFLLCLLIEFLAAMYRKEEVYAGCLLGLILAVKTIGAPVVFFLLLQRRYKTLEWFTGFYPWNNTELFGILKIPPVIPLQMSPSFSRIFGYLLLIPIMVVLAMRAPSFIIGLFCMLSLSPPMQPISWYYTQTFQLPTVALLLYLSSDQRIPALLRFWGWIVGTLALFTLSRLLGLGGINAMSGIQVALMLVVESHLPAVVALTVFGLGIARNRIQTGEAGGQ
jgi:hypothetical protein